jgi:hypothetical protein
MKEGEQTIETVLLQDRPKRSDPYIFYVASVNSSCSNSHREDSLIIGQGS